MAEERKRCKELLSRTCFFKNILFANFACIFKDMYVCDQYTFKFLGHGGDVIGVKHIIELCILMCELFQIYKGTNLDCCMR